MTAASPECEAFQAVAAELALGQLPEPERGRHLRHAGSCGPCGRELEELATAADRLLHAAPEVEPPAGFEDRVLAAAGLVAPTRAGLARSGRRRLGWVRRVPAAAVAAAVSVLVAGAALAGWIAADSSGDGQVVEATALWATGEPAGSAVLDPGADRLVLVLDGPHDWPGVWVCELRTADGSWVPVGEWTAAEVVDHRWSTPVPPELHDATAMRVLGGGGEVLITAALD